VGGLKLAVGGKQTTQWICCQLGAREHYAVPRALHRRGRLKMMVTDAWTRPGSPVPHLPGQLPRRLAERSHPDLESADVRDLTLSLIRQELEWRFNRKSDWDLHMARNEWFQAGAAKVLEQYEAPPTERVVVFAHSYSALAIFRLARARGWTTVLGQIDPGEEHFAIVRRLADAAPQYGPAPIGPPIQYFEHWREECALADHIVVNSNWSRQAVSRAGVSAAKLHVLPLAFEDGGKPAVAPRSYPEAFNEARPLRLVFIGNVSVVKGAAQLLEAMSLLSGLPVTLQLVGERGMIVPAPLTALPSVEFVGPAPRSEVARYYEASDVLVFPSHSDGFGMAQIEARAAGLPIIASPFCGSVAEDGVSGTILPEVTAHAIATAVKSLLGDPARLAAYSRNALTTSASGLTQLGAALVRLTAV
jgi:glycosyltransferase involved in cell wall biosynthesis